MNVRLFPFLSIIILLGCGPSREQQASERLQEAIELRDSGQFNLAKLKLDTLIENFDDLMEQSTKAKGLLRGIKRMEQQRNLAYLDSMLALKREELPPLMKNFIKSEEYGPETILIHKRQKPENSYNRTFLRAHLNEAGEFYISSRYQGTQWLHHNQIKVYNQGESILSEEVPEDGFNNRRFEDGDSKWEIVNYKDGKDNGIVNFIAQNWNKSLKVQFIGKKHYYIVMEQYDKEAIRDAYEISFVLKEVKGLETEREHVVQTLGNLEANANRSHSSQ